MMKNMILLRWGNRGALFLFFCWFLTPSAFTQDKFVANYTQLTQIMNDCDTSFLKVEKGLKLTYNIDSVSVRDYSIKIMGCPDLQEFMDSTSQLMKYFLCYEVLKREQSLKLKWIAHLCLSEISGVRKMVFEKENMKTKWTNEQAKVELLYWQHKIEETKLKFPKECEEVYSEGTH